MRLMLALIVIATVALLLALRADAYLIAKPTDDSRRAVHRAQTINLAHARYVCRNGARAHKRWACRASRGWLLREWRETRPAPTIPHRALWLCIHSREGDWQDGGWPYWGGLQAGAWWLSTYLPAHDDPQGHDGPNGWQNAPSPEEQMRAAERGYRESGYSRAWLYGQWPNTAPPCAALA